ncbi:MAG: transglycosylase SLT domain-containing protein [Candidatus Sulfotelmatobacter sp.]
MRVGNLQVRIALLAATAFAGASCSAKKPVAVAPQAMAPAPSAANSADPPANTKQTGSPAATANASEQDLVAHSSTQPEQRESAIVPAADSVGDLIAHVEKEYQAGLDSYQAGQTDAAKQHFDTACNTLLDSKLDIRSDDRLQQEFERIVTGIDKLNLGDLADSDVQKSEPAPIDETNGVTPSADEKTREKAQAEIKATHSDLPLMMTDQVAGYISYFSNRGRGTFERAYARSGRYHDMMVKILKEEGVPQDLIYLAQAESGFHPLAVSRVGARGIWQFMASRARGYGLQHNMWVDERQDPEKSTRAAARHLRDLYAQFGDWYLAMAAYNSGPGTVQAAVKRTGYADFWELYQRNVLPKETRNYVPIILAMTIVSKNLSQYGFDDVSMDEPIAYDEVSIDYPVNLRLVADCVGSTPEQLQDLNPSLLRLSTPRQGKFELHLPAGTKEEYETEIASIPPDMRLWWRYHKVEPGDTLASIAHSYRVTAKSIETANHLDGAELEQDAHLIIPVAPSKYAADSATYARRITRYHVRSGDTVESVAENFGISPKMLRRWNGLHSESLRGRKVLALHLPVSPGSESSSAASRRSNLHPRKTTQMASATLPGEEAATSNSSRSSKEDSAEGTDVLRHKVKSGETLYSIATAYRTTVAALRRSNGNVAILRPGMVLIVEPAR